jgi:hypothetical protein
MDAERAGNDVSGSQHASLDLCGVQNEEVSTLRQWMRSKKAATKTGILRSAAASVDLWCLLRACSQVSAVRQWMRKEKAKRGI